MFSIQILSRFFAKVWSLRAEFAKYFVIGATSFVLDVGSLYIFKQYVSLRPYVGVVINQCIVLLYVFVMNKYWSFRSHGAVAKQARRFAVLSVGNYCFSVAWMWLFTEYMTLTFLHPEYDYLIVRTANVLLAIAWNFFLYKYWIYQTDTSQLAAESPVCK